MRRSRGVLAVMLLVVVAMASAAVVAWFEVTRLPNPEKASGRDLLRWVATQDLSQYPLEVRRTLAKRLEQEFAGQALSFGGEGSQDNSAMAPEHRQLLLKNLELLVEPWILLKTEEYSALPALQQPAYVDRVLETIDLWRAAAGWLGSGAARGQSGGQGPNVLMTFVTQVEQCRERAKPQARRQIDAFLLAVQMRWVSRKISQVFHAA